MRNKQGSGPRMVPCWLKFLNANKQNTSAAERYWTVGKTTELNQSICFKNVLTSEWKSENVLYQGRGYTFTFTGNKELWIPSKLIKIRFDQGRSPENLGCRHEGRDQERQDRCMWADPLTWGQLRGWVRQDRSYYRVPVIYYMPPFHTAQLEMQITVWLFSPNELTKLTDASYLIKHRTKTYL